MSWRESVSNQCIISRQPFLWPTDYLEEKNGPERKVKMEGELDFDTGRRYDREINAKCPKPYVVCLFSCVTIVVKSDLSVTIVVKSDFMETPLSVFYI